MKIAVYTITKNEAKFIDRWAASCKDADYRIIIDTGSEDDTVEVAEKAGCTVHSIKISPWRFDDARNAALALVPDVDYCIALDADEILVEGWRQHFESLDSIVTRPRYKYVWSWNPDGSEGLTYSGDKIHARKGYRWKHPVHEVITPINGEVQGSIGLEIHHHPDPSKSRSQYLPLLELAVKEIPNDDRNRFYLGRELMFNNKNEEAKEHFLKHLELSTWKPERATSMRYLARVTGEAEHWLLRACAEAPNRRESWVDLAKFYHDIKNWSGCYFACLRALDIKEKPLEYLCEAEAWGSMPHDLASVSAWYMGLRQQALTHAQKAFELNPYDKRIKNNLAMIYRMLGSSKFEVVIPFKSNFTGLDFVVDQILQEEKLFKIHIVCDGPNAFEYAQKYKSNEKIDLYEVELGSGIHKMWNVGIENSDTQSHIAFVNDDVSLELQCLSILGGVLDQFSQIGLICPNYDNRIINSTYITTRETCRGRYDGSGGLGGFCMMLHASLANSWRFDENMKWWYGDDDLLHWTFKKANKDVGICGIAQCKENSSWTITNDPPDNFAEVVEQDRKIFESKWKD